METKAEILAWLRERIVDEARRPLNRSREDSDYRNGWQSALEWVADELEEDLPCS